jgi:L-glyceraldehyde 3-phosphate reductase
MHQANDNRYEKMRYRRSGASGLELPLISLGFWHNFGYGDSFTNMKDMVFTAFDLGITHFDLANAYGPPPGSAEEHFGKIMKDDLAAYRDEMIISTKAGYRMWPGPYGEWGGRKYLISSLDASLKRMGLEYVDIFYSHRPDPNTPMEETMQALDYAVRSGKALYVGISSYSPSQSKEAFEILMKLGTPCLIHQPSYSMFNRNIENGLTDVLEEYKVGLIVFSPLAQGLLSDKYLSGIPQDSRIARSGVFLKKEHITDELLHKVRSLNEIASSRGQTLSQMALAWVLRGGKVTSALIGASKVSQIRENVATLDNLEFTAEELGRINQILVS